MRSFVRFCLDRPITTLTVHIILLLAGFLSMQQIPLSAIPNFKRTRINVSVPYPNASPTQIENEVVRPLEEALATLRGVREIESESREGNGRVTLRFDYSTDIEAVKVEIRERLARAMDVLPIDDIERIRIQASSWGAGIDTIMEGRISAHGIDLSKNFDLLVNRIQRPIERIEGVGQVEIDGVSPLEVKISLRKEDLQRHGLTLRMITQVIQGSNIDATIGRVWKDGKVRRLRLINAMENVDQLAQLPVNSNGLRLGQVASIEHIDGV